MRKAPLRWAGHEDRKKGVNIMNERATINMKFMQEQLAKVTKAIHLLTNDHLLRPVDAEAIQMLSEVCLALMSPGKWLE